MISALIESNEDSPTGVAQSTCIAMAVFIIEFRTRFLACAVMIMRAVGVRSTRVCR